jgi:nucleotide-binding universal stress UspA family protein
MKRDEEQHKKSEPSLRDPHYPDLVFHTRGLPQRERETDDLWRRREMQRREKDSDYPRDPSYDKWKQQGKYPDDYEAPSKKHSYKKSTSSIFDSGSQRDFKDYDDKPRRGREYDSYRGYDSPSRKSGYDDRSLDADRGYDDDRYRAKSRGTGKSIRGGQDQVVCVDGSKSADRAMRFAFANVPENKRLLLLHGVYTPFNSRIDFHNRELRRMEAKYLDMCDRAGRECIFAPFEYSRNRGFSDSICHYARANRSPSIIMGKREDVSTLRRTLMGSSTDMVMQDCDVPVTIAYSEKKKYK